MFCSVMGDKWLSMGDGGISLEDGGLRMGNMWLSIAKGGLGLGDRWLTDNFAKAANSTKFKIKLEKTWKSA